MYSVKTRHSQGSKIGGNTFKYTNNHCYVRLRNHTMLARHDPFHYSLNPSNLQNNKSKYESSEYIWTSPNFSRCHSRITIKLISIFS